MDPLSLTFGVAGIVGLAGLFSTCLDVIARVESYKDFGIESQSISSQFEADKLLFQRWAQKVGISDGRLKEDHHKDLDDPETALVVEKILMSIQEIFNVTETTFSNLNRSLQANPHLSRGRSQQFKIQSGSRRSKIGWALKGKAKFITQVQQFGALVQRLQSLVPPDRSKTVLHLDKSATDGEVHILKDEFLNKVTWFSDSQRILIEIEKQIESDTRKELDRWLDAFRTNELYDDFIRKRLEGTCNWILNHPVLLEWTSPEFPSGMAKMLWVNGPAGYGKTILCARIIQHLSATLTSPVAYYFFSSDAEARGDPFGIIRSWISQLISSDQDAFELACSRWDMETGQRASRTDIIELFREIATRIPECTFVVDGLDECAWATEGWRSNTDDDSPIGLLSTIKHAIAHTSTRILIVSRDETGIRSGFHTTSENEPITLNEFKISPDDVQSDAMSFSRSVVDKKLANKNEGLRYDLSCRIVDRCEGMFLWVKMLEDQLRGGKNRKQLEEIVDKTPTALHHLYDRNWMKISGLSDKDRDRAFSILRWTTFSLRPLTILELTDALLIRDDDLYDDLLIDELPDDIDEEYVNTEILGLCGSLLETRSASPENDIGSLTVQPVHFSVKQYIICNISVPGVLETNERLRFSNEAVQNNFLAKLCLRYVNFEKVWREPVRQDGKAVIRPLRDYAAGSWHQHLNQSGVNYEGAVRLINTLFHPRNKNWESWRKWFDNAEQGSKSPNGIPIVSPLYYASLLGLRDTVVFLTEGLKLDLNYADWLGRTALQGACSGNRISVVRLLLEKGADVAVANITGWTPLNSASSQGYVDVVKLLLEKGADMAISSNGGRTPLDSASNKGHVEVVKLLLENGADVAVADESGWTPLNSASSEGHVEVVELLLKKGADMAVASNKGWTPLHQSSFHGHADVVKLLLEMGADVAVATNSGFTPLVAASLGGHIEVVNFLLEKGADMAVTDNDGWTPLNMASSMGYIEVVKFLLENGADVAVASNGGWTSLNSASANGHIEVVKLLLENGADMAVADKNGWAPLHSASANGHIEVVKALLQKGADLTAANNEGWTPLNSASSEGHVEVVKLLLEKGADVSAANDDGWTPLKSTSTNGHVEVVKLLLERGADVLVANNGGWTPLNSASSKGHVEVVKLLLENGADGSAANHDGWTPLNSASSEGHVEVIKLLLERGADVTIASNRGLAPLHSASQMGHVEVVKLLLENGASPISKDTTYGRTPLFLALRRGQKAVAKLLLSSDDNPNSEDIFGRRPLSVAAAGGHKAVVKLLLTQDGIDTTFKDVFGRTPLSDAQRRGNLEAVTLLLAGGNASPILDEDTSDSEHSATDHQGRIFCDICLADVPDTHIHSHCQICDKGDFDICQECIACGAFCLDNSHKLTERTVKDGVFVEVPGLRLHGGTEAPTR